MLSTQSTSIMSIGAITSPCSKKTECNLTSLHNVSDSTISTTNIPQHKQQYGSVSVGRWIHNTNTDVLDRYPTHTMMHTTSTSSSSNRSRYHSISVPSPSFSSSSSNSSDHDEEDELHQHQDQHQNQHQKQHQYHQQHHRQHHQQHQYRRSRQNSLILNFNSAFNGGRPRSFNNKSDALATRRARNKLASAKYRAKKQALTHAMQDRIMQLATQVMDLREELIITKKNEHELKTRYERLMQIHNNNTTSIDKNTIITRLY
ncbi:hypothetical protein INT46_001362 [Mucor plumbeus]|uniref:BZIP domain-containing protein n=1 Tax=Mucor plumbeus TaxID=97098 RepID=A0A8H7RFF0_9FUNG|nr:hypothetical protein INT46_001362 [Mucor plumbeus]